MPESQLLQRALEKGKVCLIQRPPVSYSCWLTHFKHDAGFVLVLQNKEQDTEFLFRLDFDSQNVRDTERPWLVKVGPNETVHKMLGISND